MDNNTSSIPAKKSVRRNNLLLKMIRPFIKRLIRYYIFHDPRKALSLRYWLNTLKRIDWNSPKDLNEKILYLEGTTDLSEWTRLADKIKVREFLNERGVLHYSPKILGIWDNADDIDLNTLPQKFVLKCNHDYGSVKIIDKSDLSNWKAIKNSLNQHVNKPFGIETVELHYLNIERKIFAEEYIENKSSFSNSIVDYKFWCFNGIPKYCFIVIDRNMETHIGRYDLYELDPWKRCIDMMTDDVSQYKPIQKPELLDEMISLAKVLSKGFPQVRVDLYQSGDKIYFGEMTFTSADGNMWYFTQEALIKMGDMITSLQSE